MAAAAETLERERVRTAPTTEPEQFEAEEKRSFDINASVRMFRHDLNTHGFIRPETYQQACDEELTFIAEGIDRHSYTSFNLKHDEELGLVMWRKGEWQPYISTLINGREAAKNEARADYRKEFLVDWTERDLGIGYALEKLEPGEVFCWDNPFPKKLAELYGEEFMLECGLQPKREMGFLYRAERNADGSVTLETHTVDNSDPEAFEVVRELIEKNPKATIEERLRAYDDRLFIKNGEVYRAGRLKSEEKDQVNAYEFVKGNKEYVKFYMDQIAEIATSSLDGKLLKDCKKDLTYGFWARIKELLDEQQPVSGIGQSYNSTYQENSPLSHQQIAYEMHGAHRRASVRQEVLAGCGGSVTSSTSFDKMSPESVFDSIFGEGLNKDEDSKSVSKVMKCVNCPKCRTHHDEVKPAGGKYRCKNSLCGYEAAA